MRMILVAAALVMLSIPTAQATSNIGALRQSSHWCNWSIAKTCTRWKANKDNPAYFRSCGPNDMRSGCVAHRKGLR
jgi:hypothetical protein